MSERQTFFEDAFDVHEYKTDEVFRIVSMASGV